MSNLEVYVYEPSQDNLYVHHDIPLPVFPLCLAWLEQPPATVEKSPPSGPRLYPGPHFICLRSGTRMQRQCRAALPAKLILQIGNSSMRSTADCYSPAVSVLSRQGDAIGRDVDCPHLEIIATRAG